MPPRMIQGIVVAVALGLVAWTVVWMFGVATTDPRTEARVRANTMFAATALAALGDDVATMRLAVVPESPEPRRAAAIKAAEEFTQRMEAAMHRAFATGGDGLHGLAVLDLGATPPKPMLVAGAAGDLPGAGDIESDTPWLAGVRSSRGGGRSTVGLVSNQRATDLVEGQGDSGLPVVLGRSGILARRPGSRQLRRSTWRAHVWVEADALGDAALPPRLAAAGMQLLAALVTEHRGYARNSWSLSESFRSIYRNVPHLQGIGLFTDPLSPSWDYVSHGDDIPWPKDAKGERIPGTNVEVLAVRHDDRPALIYSVPCPGPKGETDWILRLLFTDD